MRGWISTYRRHFASRWLRLHSAAATVLSNTLLVPSRNVMVLVGSQFQSGRHVCAVVGDRTLERSYSGRSRYLHIHPKSTPPRIRTSLSVSPTVLNNPSN